MLKPNVCNVQPLGNALSNADTKALSRRQTSLGKLTILPDALLTRILDVLVHTAPPNEAADALNSLRLTSTYLCAFASDEDLWRRIVLHNNPPAKIAIASAAPSWRVAHNHLKTPSTTNYPSSPCPPPPSFPPVYSDILYHKQRCLTAQIPPEWLVHDNATRISPSTTSSAIFRARYEKPGIPVVITDVVSTWPAAAWAAESLSTRFPDSTFHAGGFDFPLADYFQYCANVTSRDDQPLYIFDHDFAAKAPALATEYSVLSYFAEDMFRVLGEHHRPDYRWLIVGPARSGSSFHKDPNATAAWNAVVKGEKKWLLFPPDRPPPGVVPSGDEGDVTAPVSVMEWFLNFYDHDVLEEYGAVECVVKEGEMIFVPMGWWHCVLNTTTSIAITQNYVSEANVEEVVTWLRERPGQVSGCRTLEQARHICDNFARLVAEEYPYLQANLGLSTETNQRSKCPNAVGSVSRKKRKPNLWDTLKASPLCENDTSAPERAVNGMPRGLDQPMFSFGF